MTCSRCSPSGENVHTCVLEDGTLRLAFVSTTEGEHDGVPAEAWQRLMYDTAAFTSGTEGREAGERASGRRLRPWVPPEDRLVAERRAEPAAVEAHAQQLRAPRSFEPAAEQHSVPSGSQAGSAAKPPSSARDVIRVGTPPAGTDPEQVLRLAVGLGERRVDDAFPVRAPVGRGGEQPRVGERADRVRPAGPDAPRLRVTPSMSASGAGRPCAPSRRRPGGRRASTARRP